MLIEAMGLFSLFIFVIVVVHSSKSSKHLSVLQRIRQTSELAEFRHWLDNDWGARQNLQYSEITIFAPTNDAVWRYRGPKENLVNYHMIWYAKTMKNLQHEGTFQQDSLYPGGPPLWFRWTGEQLYVNNALVRKSLSDYVSNFNAGNGPAKKQILHVIDEVLDPMIVANAQRLEHQTPPTCLQLLTQTQLFKVNGNTVAQFRDQVLATFTQHLFNTTTTPSTFFIPVDSELFPNLDEEAIRGHIIPNKVLFLRPTEKGVPFTTLANQEHWEIIITFFESQGRVVIKSYPLTTSHVVHPLTVEVVQGNIPLRNGVAHLIQRPLGVFQQQLTLFPFLPIMDKLAADPTLSTAYDLGVNTDFNQQLEQNRKRFTYFVPDNRAWDRSQQDLQLNSTFFQQFTLKYGRGLLGRHLLIDGGLTMAALQNMSKNRNETDITVNTASGKLVIGVDKVDDYYYIYWLDKVIKVIRADYMCTNGVVHIVTDVLITKQDVEGNDGSQQSEGLVNLIFLLAHGV